MARPGHSSSKEIKEGLPPKALCRANAEYRAKNKLGQSANRRSNGKSEVSSHQPKPHLKRKQNRTDTNAAIAASMTTSSVAHLSFVSDRVRTATRS
jgi:hypothetical protein